MSRLAPLPQGYTWKSVTHIVPGDLVHRWGEILKVIDTHHEEVKIILDVEDGEQVKSWDYKIDAELIVKEKG